LRPKLRYSNPTPPLAKAPRRVMMVDVRTDKHGFLFDGDLASIAGKKIFCIGGSTTAGIESRHDRHYPAALDRLVQPLGYRCINAGVGGYRSIHELLAVKHRVLRHSPWGIVLYSGYNDFEDYAHGAWAPGNAFRHCLSHVLPTSTTENLLLYSALSHVGKQLLHRIFGAVRTENAPTFQHRGVGLDAALDDPQWLAEWRRNIGAIMELCRDRGIRCFMIAHATPVYDGAPQEAKDFADIDINMDGRFDRFTRYIDLIDTEAKALCDRYGATFLDIRTAFAAPFMTSEGGVDYKARFGAFVDRAHLTEDGNAHLAACIFDLLKRDL
jgi:lysophospholipase L1-like esterase